MRIKVGDPGSHLVSIYINGEKCDLCVDADEELGMAKVYVMNWSEHILKYKNSVIRKNAVPEEPSIATVYGDVKIKTDNSYNDFMRKYESI